MAKKYQKDIKVVLPKSDPFRDIAVYGAGEELIKALGGQLPDKGKQPDIVPSSNNPYFKKGIKKYANGGVKDKDIPKNITSNDYINPIKPIAIKAAEYWDTALDVTNKALGNATDAAKKYILQDPVWGPKYTMAEAKFKPWLFENVRPVEYPNPISGPKNLIKGALGLTPSPEKDSAGKYAIGEEAWKKSLGLNTEQNYIIPSKYRPEGTKDEKRFKEYYKIKEGVVDPNKLIQEAKKRNLTKGEIQMESLSPFIKKGFMDSEKFKDIDPLQRFQLGAGQDKKGKYVSVRDIYDFEGPLKTLTTPYGIYDRYYYKADGGPLNNTESMKKSNKKGQSPRSILSPEQRMAMQFGWGGGLSGGLSGAATGASIGSVIPGVGTAIGAGVGALVGGISGHLNEKKQDDMQNMSMQMPYQQPLPPQMQFAKGGMLNKRGIPHRGTSEQMPYQHQMQSYPNLEFGNGEQMLANGGELDDTEMFAEGGIHIKPSKRGTFTAAATKHGKSVQGFASQVLANKENYSPAMVKKANFARNAAKWKHADGGFLQEPAEGVIERRNKNRSREPQEYATFEENFKHMYAQGGHM